MIVRIILGVGCLVMGVLSLSGYFVCGGPNERWIVGIGWILIGAGWLGRWYIAKRRSRPGSGERRGSEDKSGF